MSQVRMPIAEYAAARWAALSEADFERWVISFARAHGWRVAHFRPARTTSGWRTAMSGDRGFPDLVMAKPGRPLLVVELKSSRGRLSEDQRRWLEALTGRRARDWRPGVRFDRYGLVVAVWGPADRADIEAELT